MLFFTELLESKVLDSAGRTVGKLHDIGMQVIGRFPQSRFLVLSRYRRGRRETVTVPWEWVSSLGPAGITLDRKREEIWKSDHDLSGLLLARNLLELRVDHPYSRDLESDETLNL